MTADKHLINIAVVGDGLSAWGGGIDFTRLVVGSMDLTRYRPILYLPDATGLGPAALINAAIYPILGLKSPMTIVDDIYDRIVFDMHRDLSHRNDMVRSLRSIVPDLRVQYYSNDAELIGLMRRDSISLVLPTARMLGRRFPVPWVPFFNDLQHKYYPEYFSEGSRRFRDREARRLLESTRDVVVSSVAVKEDIDRFCPGHGCSVHPIPFAAPGPRYDPGPDHMSLRERYGVNGTYFVVMNQFWRHKNHMVVLKALAELKARGELDFQVVFTGKAEDRRFPEYYPGLLRFIEDEGLGEFVKMVGFIPKKDQIGLLYGARALVQPTLFEGGAGGLASIDAASYGVPVLLSDIPVNHHVEGVEMEFFRPDDARGLAQMMLARSEQERRVPSMEELKERSLKGEARLRDFIDAIVTSAIGHGPVGGRE